MSTVEYQVIVKEGPAQGKVYPLNAPSLTIGRDPMSDIVLSDPEVSRYHARLTQTADGGYKIEDMKSTNSTHVDGVRVGAEPIRLVPSQTILFGSTVELRYDTIADVDAAAITMLHNQEDINDMDEIHDEHGEDVEPVMVPDDVYAPSLPQTSDKLVPPPPSMPDFVDEAEVGTEVLDTDVFEEKRPFVANDGIIEPEIPANNKNRNIAIGVSATLFLLCCCCVIVPLVTYFWLGDVVLESMGMY